MYISFFRVASALIVNTMSRLSNNPEIYAKELILPFATYKLFVHTSQDWADLSYKAYWVLARKKTLWFKIGIDAGTKITKENINLLLY